MSEFQLSFINGLMLGIEHVKGENLHEDMAYGVVVDLFLLRITYVKWLRED